MTTYGISADIYKIADIVNGKLYNIAHKKLVIKKVVIDSRQVDNDTLFVPLKGNQTDGHFYLEEAFSRGALSAFVNKKFFDMAGAAILRYAAAAGASFIVVDDTLKALQHLAEFYMSEISAPVRIGVTGSNGKTTVKEMLVSVISKQTTSLDYTHGNLNSEIGLPLSILKMQKGSKYLVFEMGIDHFGEMDILAQLVRPNNAIITGIGTAHIGAFGSRENIAREKGKIFSSFDDNSLGLIPEDETFFDVLKGSYRGKIEKYGFLSTDGLKSWKENGINGSVIQWKGFDINICVPGRHIVKNALAVIKLAKRLGIDDKIVAEGLESYRPLFGRWQIVRGDADIILDCYNSNPDSLRASLSTFSDIKTDGRKKVAILGDMLDLGDKEKSLHEEIADYISKMNIDVIVFIGPRMRYAFECLKSREGCFYFDSVDAARKKVEEIVKTGDIVLCKASRAMELEGVVSNFLKGAINA